MVTSRQILGDTVTAYEIKPNSVGKQPEPAQVDEEVVRQIYKKLVQASEKLTEAMRSQSTR
jgi:hypothetical protein